METRLLEIHLISAQGLKPPSGNLRAMQSYAVAWVDPCKKLRTRVDKLGGENPTWNDKFFFRVTSEFLACETSAIAVEIYALGYLKDPLIGTVRFILSNFLPNPSGSSPSGMCAPSFTALQIRRPSGRFHGVLNVGAMVMDGTSFSVMAGVTAIGFRDLIGETRRRGRRHRRKIREENENSSSFESADFSDGAESTTSSSSSVSTVLKELNGVKETTDDAMALDGGGSWCGLMHQRKIHLSPSDQNLNVLEEKTGR